VNQEIIAGDPAQTGELIGRRDRDLIIAALSRWQDFLKEEHQISLSRYAAFIWKNGFFRKSIDAFAPDLFAECLGMAEGAGVDSKALYAWQLADEHQLLMPEFKNTISPEPAGCSTFGIFLKGELHIAQNLDIPGYKDGLQRARIIKSGSLPPALVCSQAGLLGSFGMNSCGLGIAVNSLSQLCGQLSGLPVSFLVRKLLQQDSFEVARDFLQRVPHASGQNYLLAGGSENKMANFECGAGGVRELAGEINNPLLHTNHPLGNWPPEAIVPGALVSESSTSRLQALQQEVLADQQMDQEAFLALLRRAPLKVAKTSPSAISTFISASMNLSRGSGLVLTGQVPAHRFQLT
jgi:isopenicillin-N N-acyltransferase like protein